MNIDKTEKLILAVQENEILYDVEHPKYSNRTYQDVTWDKIALIVGLSGNSTSVYFDVLKCCHLS